MMSATEVVRQFGHAFACGQIDALVPLLAEDCIDANPGPLQPSGRDGVVWKAAAFHARFAGFTTTLTAVGDRADGSVIADWTTRFPDGSVTHWRGTFAVAGTAIARFEVEHVG
jgi:hypothetical protein